MEKPRLLLGFSVDNSPSPRYDNLKKEELPMKPLVFQSDFGLVDGAVSAM